MHVLVLLEDLERQKVAKSSVCFSNVCLVMFSFSLVAVVEDDAPCFKSQEMCFDIKLALDNVPAWMDWH